MGVDETTTVRVIEKEREVAITTPPPQQPSAVTGKVKSFSHLKGYGFIVGPSGEDVFVHYTAIEGSGFRQLKDGEQVRYLFTRTANGLAATHVWRQQEDSVAE